VLRRRSATASDRCASPGVAIAPMNTALSVELGQVLLARGDRAGARAASCRRCRSPRRHLTRCFGLGTILAAEGAHGAAADAFRRSLLCHPGYTPALLNLGQCLLALGDLERGLRLLPHGGAQRCSPARSVADVAGKVEPRPVLAEAQRRGAFLRPGKPLATCREFSRASAPAANVSMLSDRAFKAFQLRETAGDRRRSFEMI